MSPSDSHKTSNVYRASESAFTAHPMGSEKDPALTGDDSAADTDHPLPTGAEALPPRLGLGAW